MEVWADPKCANCLPCEYLIDSERNIFRQRIDPSTSLPYDPVQWEFTGFTTTEFLGQATELVAEMLRQRGYDYGICIYEYRPPCRCGCEGVCVCGVTVDYIDLSMNADVQSIEAVFINGIQLPYLDVNGRPNWELVNKRYLVKRDPHADCTMPATMCGECGAPGSAVDSGDSTWPSMQRIDLPLTDQCTWGVRYRAGVPVPQSVRRAVECVACTLMKECLGIPCSQLPDGVETVSQFGVSVSFRQLQESLDGVNDTYGCASVRRMLSVHPQLVPTGWGDPMAGCPVDFLYQPRAVCS